MDLRERVLAAVDRGTPRKEIVGINRALRERLRVRLNRDPQPNAGVADPGR